jgi:uncharacterized metal-binding protein
MPELPKKKVGLISCSGEELAEGTLSRVATLRVLEQLRPNDTSTICLPLFLAGNDKERAFARFYPTITIDGCAKRCAARATEKYSAKPTKSIVIPDFLGACGLSAPRSRRQMDVSREPVADALAQEIALQVDEILGVCCAPSAERTARESESATVTCSCGSGVPATRLNIAGKEVEVIALPLIFEQSRQANKTFDELFSAVQVYNAIPVGFELLYREVIQREYAAYCARQ